MPDVDFDTVSLPRTNTLPVGVEARPATAAPATSTNLSWADAGSGVAAFVLTALVLALLVEPLQPARRVVATSALTGLVAIVLDIFVL